MSDQKPQFLDEIYRPDLCTKCKKTKSWDHVKSCKEDDCPEKSGVDAD